MDANRLIALAFDDLLRLLNQKELSPNDQKALVKNGNNLLFLSMARSQSDEQIKIAHDFLVRCYDRVGRPDLAEKHSLMAKEILEGRKPSQEEMI